MSAINIVHNDTIIFDGTNYLLWRNCFLCKFRTLCPNIEQFLDVGFSPPMDPQNLSLEEEKNLDLEAKVSNEFILTLSSIVYVFLMVTKCKSSHEIWTKLEETFGGSNLHDDSLSLEVFIEDFSSSYYHEEILIASTSNCGDITTSSTSLKIGRASCRERV